MNAVKRAIFDQHEQERYQRVERQKKEAQEKQSMEQEQRRLETEQERLREAERVQEEKEVNRVRKEQEVLGRVRKELDVLDRVRKEQEEPDRVQKEQQELDRVRKEQEELDRAQQEKQKLDRDRREQEKLDRVGEEEEKRLERAKAAELERFQKENEVKDPEEQLKVRTRDEMIEDRMQELLTTTRATDARKQQVLELMERLASGLRTHFQQEDIKVLLYGSFATGLCDQSSDADFSVIDGSQKIKSVTALAKALRELGCTHVASIPHARVPIVTFEDPVSSIQCDISLNQCHGVYNSKLIDAYRRTDDRFMPLWFAIRHLARKNNILSGRLRYLTSYALVMMMIAFLQVQRKPVLPRLQHTGTLTKGPVIENSDYSFDENWSKYASFGSTNGSTSALLLKEFCRFFGSQVDFGKYEINPRLGIIRKTRRMQDVKPLLDRKALMEAPICIMDPFNLSRNLTGNVPQLHVKQIQKVFTDTNTNLINGDIDGLFS